MNLQVSGGRCLVLVGLILALILTGCQNKVESAKIQEPIPVKVSQITLQDIDETLEYVGNIKAEDEAVIYPKVSGKIIEKVKEDGAKIKKDEVICYIDRDEVGLKFEKAPVESTLSGVVGRFYVDLGQRVSTLTPVALVVDMEKVKIELDIPEKYLPRVTLNGEARIKVDAYPQETFVGEVTKISPVLDLDTRTAPIEITILNQDHRLQSGMFARTALVLEARKNVPVIIKEALIGKGENNYLYVVENKKAVLKKVSLGVRQGAFFEVTEGLSPGDLVVVMGQQKLFEDAPVVIENGNYNNHKNGKSN